MFCHFVGLCGYVILKVSVRHFVFVFSQTCFLLVASAYLHDRDGARLDCYMNMVFRS